MRILFLFLFTISAFATNGPLFNDRSDIDKYEFLKELYQQANETPSPSYFVSDNNVKCREAYSLNQYGLDVVFISALHYAIINNGPLFPAPKEPKVLFSKNKKDFLTLQLFENTKNYSSEDNTLIVEQILPHNWRMKVSIRLQDDYAIFERKNPSHVDNFGDIHYLTTYGYCWQE